jgi:hypothetical protein
LVVCHENRRSVPVGVQGTGDSYSEGEPSNSGCVATFATIRGKIYTEIWNYEGGVRGDAANGRHQYCYVSADSRTNAGSKANKNYLIFEFGEVESAFYLFWSEPDWKGSEYCKVSTLVSRNLGTRSGLKLGMTPMQLEAILGKPSFEQDERIIYVRNLRVKPSPEELKRARAYAGDMSAESFRKNYSFYEFSTYIEGLFFDSKLKYLAIKQGETL